MSTWEDFLLLVLRDTDAGIDHRKSELCFAFGFGVVTGDLHGDGTRVGKLVGVADQVDQDLVQFAGIAAQPDRIPQVHIELKLIVFFVDRDLHQANHVIDELDQVESSVFQLEFAGFEL